jgi:hypothetical protein
MAKSNLNRTGTGTGNPTPVAGKWVALPRAPKGNTYASKHGLVTLKQAIKGLGGRVMERRTTLGKALHKWRADLISDLGGQDNISTQQSDLVGLAVKSKLLLDSIDAWLLTRETLINKRKKALLLVVLQRQTLADGLAC